MLVRARLTLAFAASMTLVLVALALYLYSQLGNALLQSVDLDLRSRADALAATVAAAVPSPVGGEQRLIDPDEAFAQVLSAAGAVLDTSPGIGTRPLLGIDSLTALRAPAFFDRHVIGVGDPARLLAVPVPRTAGPVIVVVGTNLGDRSDALHRLLTLLWLGIPAAVLLTAGIGWLVAGAAVRPAERALERERRFLDEASHDLRTPLAVLKAELDVTLSRPRSNAELGSALRAAAGDTDRLVTLTENLLVVARTRAGPLALRVEEVSLRALLTDTAAVFQRVRTVQLECPDEMVRIDPLRVGQAVRNLIDNAIRHGGQGPVRVAAWRAGRWLHIVVSDDGPGFPEWLVAGVPANRLGLGLRIVDAIAHAHGGRIAFRNVDGGAAAELIVLA